MEGYVTKPIHTEELKEAISRFARVGEGFPVPGHDEPASGPNSPKLLGTQEILARFDEDRVLVTEVLGLFMDAWPPMLAEIQQAILGRNAKTLQMAAHSFRGAASNFCIGKSLDLAARLEALGKDGTLTEAPALGEALGKEMLRITPLLQDFLREMDPCTS